MVSDDGRLLFPPLGRKIITSVRLFSFVERRHRQRIQIGDDHQRDALLVVAHVDLPRSRKRRQHDRQRNALAPRIAAQRVRTIPPETDDVLAMMSQVCLGRADLRLARLCLVLLVGCVHCLVLISHSA